MRLPETDSLPPNNPEAEIALLGACLVDSAVAGTLDPRHFYDPKRQLIARILRTKARDGLAHGTLRSGSKPRQYRPTTVAWLQ